MTNVAINIVETPEAPETIATSELLLFSIEKRIGRVATSLEGIAKAGGVEELTRHVDRLATAISNIAYTLDCVTETVTGEDGVERCSIRTHDSRPNMLAVRDERL
jgi:hypothetical protein